MDDDAQQLRKRVAELEETVDEQQSLIKRMLPNRRQVLTGAAAVGGFALGAGGATAADTTDGRHAAKFGQFSQLEDPGGDTWADVPDSGDVDLKARGFTNVSTIENDDYHETVVTQSGSTGNLDLSSANVFKQTVTGNISFSFNNASSSPAGNSFVLIIQQDSTGGHSISYPSSVEFGGGSKPGLSTSANDKHMLSFVSLDGGSSYIGVVSATEIA